MLRGSCDRHNMTYRAQFTREWGFARRVTHMHVVSWRESHAKLGRPRTRGVQSTKAAFSENRVLTPWMVLCVSSLVSRRTVGSAGERAHKRWNG